MCEDKDVDPPRELKYFWRSKSWGLPYEGGWMKQPAGLITRMTTLGNVYNAMELYRKCDKNLVKVKERYGVKAFNTIVSIKKVIRGYD